MQKIALIVGRFQPFHKGHLFLINEALKRADKIIVAIGSSNITDVNNPIDYETRRKVIKAVFYKEKISDKLLKIVPLDDFFDDKKWLENLKKQVGEFDIALGNNAWTNNILEKAGYRVLRVDYYKRPLYEGWRIRKLIKEGKEWQNRVPKYLINFISHYPEQPLVYDHIILGGTFDHLHKGHHALLDKAIEIGNNITIGIAEGRLLDHKLLKDSIESFGIRKKNVKKYVAGTTKIKIIAFSDVFGITLSEQNIDAIVASRETLKNVLKINEERLKIGFKPLYIIIIEDVLDEDGMLISSERIRAGEIDREGKKYQISNINPPVGGQKEIKMPESLRPTLQKPLGRIFKNEKILLKSIEKTIHPMIIAVGDVIVDSLLKSEIDPDVKIIDFRTRRKKFPFFNFHFSIKSQLLNLEKHENKPGTINLKTAKIIKEKINSALHKKEKSWIVAEGEEDLLTLPAILFAPLNSLVLYGHWQHGIIAVTVDEKIKEKVMEIIKKFS